MRYAGDLKAISIGDGACSEGTRACSGLGYMLDDEDVKPPNDPVTISEVVLTDNVCNGDSVCEDCLYKTISANLTNTLDTILTVSSSSQCPNGPFDYSVVP